MFNSNNNDVDMLKTLKNIEKQHFFVFINVLNEFDFINIFVYK